MMKKKILGITMVLALTLVCAIPAFAKTVYYNGNAVSWDYGRKLGVYSYSTVQTGLYEHSATANTTFSGWKKPGVKAHAEQLVGLGTATAYWNCR
ncbi:MAG: hypothetical protein ACLRZ9_00305 [Eubacterium sp.]